MEEGSYCEMEMTQIEGVTSTVRETEANLGKDAKLVITEKLMTHDKQVAKSNVVANLNGKGKSRKANTKAGTDKRERGE